MRRQSSGRDVQRLRHRRARGRPGRNQRDGERHGGVRHYRRVGVHVRLQGDDSGTNKKELIIWDESGVDPSGKWYREIGKGMGDTLVQAGQSGAYTLADRGTFLSMKNDVELVIHVQGPLKGGPVILKNPYGVMAVNPAKYSDVNYQAAMAYIGFLTSPQGQSMIENYTANGSQLFFPNAISETPNFQQYVPQGYSAQQAKSLSKRDKQFLYWVENEVPANY
ncbi:substrate-binding domain-containing protein [Haloarculaceae archaeon H-GB2-1]|nr:substrate-binding domain-containing protein [Haloarculaceae archaeon H-GB11]MEA5406914.1 substrate-binding domain-containing protein [Haloarculaceae archaeon H-GB2-1]